MSENELAGALTPINTQDPPTPRFPLDPYHARYQVLEPFVDVIATGKKRRMVLVWPLIVMQYGADGKRRAEYIALTTEVQEADRPRVDAGETKVGGSR